MPGKTVSHSWRQGPGKSKESFIPPVEVGGEHTGMETKQERGLPGGRSGAWCQEHEEEMWETCEEDEAGSHLWWGQM